MSNEQSIARRKQAMEALQESTTMLKVARNLLEQGNRKEAVRLQEGARAKCNVSVWLVAQANTLEDASPRHIPPPALCQQFHDSQNLDLFAPLGRCDPNPR